MTCSPEQANPRRQENAKPCPCSNCYDKARKEYNDWMTEKGFSTIRNYPRDESGDLVPPEYLYLVMGEDGHIFGLIVFFVIIVLFVVAAVLAGRGGLL